MSGRTSPSDFHLGMKVTRMPFNGVVRYDKEPGRVAWLNAQVVVCDHGKSPHATNRLLIT